MIVDAVQSRLTRMRRAVLTAARLAAQSSPRGGRWVMVTLTYRPEVSWESKHISNFTNCVRTWASRKGFRTRYLWVMELTRANVPHYHCLIWIPKGFTLPKADEQGWWKHGMTRTELARSAVGYLAKYSSKGSSGQFPKGGRIHGHGGLDFEARLELRWWMLPRYVREHVSSLDRVVRKAGGFVAAATGEFFRSAWAFAGCGPGFVRLVKIAP